MASSDTLSPEKIERIRARYEARDETIAAICADEGVNEKTLHALRRKLEWRPRSKALQKAAAGGRKPTPRKAKATARRAPAKKPAKARPVSAPPPGAVDMPTLIARIRRQLQGALEAAQERGPAADPDKTANLMASLTRTLQTLRALEKDTTQDERRDDGSDAPPLDLAELRRELARRIDLLRQDRGDT
ncbi:MAG: hypothetical protein KF904_19075 [Rhodoblastus sp.]|nr:hypothetical protein [Rhodoblastus sp.]MCC2101739.1 hypothetical protein [Hyphomicrobiales bacterium]